MSEEKQKENQIINIDGNDYNVKDFSEEQVKFANMVLDCDRKIGSMQFNLEQISLGRDAWMKKLQKSLKENEILEEVVA